MRGPIHDTTIIDQKLNRAGGRIVDAVKSAGDLPIFEPSFRLRVMTPFYQDKLQSKSSNRVESRRRTPYQQQSMLRGQ